MTSRNGDRASATAGSVEVGPTDCFPYIMTIVAMTKPSVPTMTSSGPPRISLGGDTTIFLHCGRTKPPITYPAASSNAAPPHCCVSTVAKLPFTVVSQKSQPSGQSGASHRPLCDKNVESRTYCPRHFSTASVRLPTCSLA